MNSNELLVLLVILIVIIIIVSILQNRDDKDTMNANTDREEISGSSQFEAVDKMYNSKENENNG